MTSSVIGSLLENQSSKSFSEQDRKNSSNLLDLLISFKQRSILIKNPLSISPFSRYFGVKNSPRFRGCSSLKRLAYDCVRRVPIFSPAFSEALIASCLEERTLSLLSFDQTRFHKKNLRVTTNPIFMSNTFSPILEWTSERNSFTRMKIQRRYTNCSRRVKRQIYVCWYVK